MKFILGKKMQMTQIWDKDKVLAVTPVLAGPCVVTQVKTLATDKYAAVQLAFGERKEKNLNKPQKGHFKKAGVLPMHIREFRNEENKIEIKIGDQISAATFSAGDIINVTGTSKGCGFQGVVKRHGFQGGRKSHGNKDQLRMPGSVGAKGPAHIFKGMRMGGRMGNERVTIQNLTIADVDTENNILYIKGAVPGANGGLLMIKGAGELLLNTAPVIIKTPIEEEVKAETVPVVAETVATEEVPAVEEKPIEAEVPAVEEKTVEAAPEEEKAVAPAA